MWFPCAHHLVSRWTPFGFQVDTMWFPGGQHRVSKVDTMWFLQDTTGFPHGCHVVYIWTPCVVEVTTWKLAQNTALHVANWLPCFYFIPFSIFPFSNYLYYTIVFRLSDIYSSEIKKTEVYVQCKSKLLQYLLQICSSSDD